MNTGPFRVPGRFFRGNLHTHSTRSDGHTSPEEVCGFYRQSGYDFLALTDHFLERYDFPITDTRPYRTDGFTTILGAELHTGKTEFGQLWHILAVGLPLDFAPYPPGETAPEVCARALAAGAFVAAAHPAWYGITEADIRSLGAIQAVEVYNGTAIDDNDKADSWYVMDVLLRRGFRYYSCATDDAHFNPRRDDRMRGWVNVKCGHLEPEALLDALKSGCYYSSTGPSIYDIRPASGDKIVVRCSPASNVFLTGNDSTKSAREGNGFTEAELNLNALGDSPCFRVTVRDAAGKRAWSNPIWRE
ncbi:MAG TPA: CehA/McbA family metallohydrolase [Chthonomonadaceae bacterium]|nr:CehA/McbA family metallohydrolase [Chthonomonadaceae bacterium]